MLPKSPLARMFIYGAIAVAILLPITLSIDWFPEQGSASAHKIDTLYDVLLIASVPIFVLVMTVAIYSVIRFRARPDDMRDGPPIHGNARLEVAWVTIPFLLVTGLAIYAWITLNDIETKKKGEMLVHVYGRQFEWSYAYQGPHGRLIQSNELYLPVDKPVKFLIRTRDVIHSFWVPDFRLKSDAVPGITTNYGDLSFAGHMSDAKLIGLFQVSVLELRWLSGPSPAGGGGPVAWLRARQIGRHRWSSAEN